MSEEGRTPSPSDLLLEAGSSFFERTAPWCSLPFKGRVGEGMGYYRSIRSIVFKYFGARRAFATDSNANP